MRTFSSNAEARAYVERQRSAGVQAMDDQALVMIIMGGNDEPDFTACDEEMLRRIEIGNRPMMRCAWGILFEMWAARRVSTWKLIEVAEPIVRQLAECGPADDVRPLAAVLGFKGTMLRSERGPDAAYDTEVEALKLVGRIANDAHDVSVIQWAATEHALLAAFASPSAVASAHFELWAESLGEQRMEPEVAEAVAKRSNPEGE